MTHLTAVIVDDEEQQRKGLSALLQRRHPGINLLGMAEDVPSGIALIKESAPQLLFLDIDLKN